MQVFPLPLDNQKRTSQLWAQWLPALGISEQEIKDAWVAHPTKSAEPIAPDKKESL